MDERGPWLEEGITKTKNTLSFVPDLSFFSTSLSESSYSLLLTFFLLKEFHCKCFNMLIRVTLVLNKSEKDNNLFLFQSVYQCA